MTTENATRPETDAAALPVVTCRLCGSTDLRSFVDLGATPPCELFLTAAALEAPEPTYPLHVRVCERCLLAQLPPLITPAEAFTEYLHRRPQPLQARSPGLPDPHPGGGLVRVPRRC